MARMGPIVAFFVIINFLMDGSCGAQYFGKFIGKLSELHHGVSGEVYAVDGRTLYIKDFTYDGQGPAAYFYAGTSRTASNDGLRLRDENGNPEVLRKYRKEGVTITLPEGKTLNTIKIFYVWCEEFSVNFGDVKIPRNFDYPRPQKIEPLKGVHAVASDNIVIVDAQTLLIPNLSYDGGAPDAKFWVGRGSKPSPQGIRVPDENGKEVPLRKYDHKTIVLTLPGDLTVFDIGHFGIWCEAFTVDFGHVKIPQVLNIPPSLKMLGVSPQSKLNCEVLYDDLAFEVRWAVAGDSIVLQLVAKLDEREYMSFGISGDESKSVMIGGDVVVAWVDKETLKGFAEDYYLDTKSQCSGPSGSCPDSRLAENTNNIRLLNAALVNGYSIVTYQRPLKASDNFDNQIHTNKSQAIIWAIGPLNQRNEVSFHSQYTKGDHILNFGRPPKWNCPMPETEQPPMKAAVPKSSEELEVAVTIPTTSAKPRNSERRRGTAKTQEVKDTEKSASRNHPQTERKPSRIRANPLRAVPTPAPVSTSNAWDIPAIQCYEPEDGVFYAQMGPTGGKRGYPAITGHVGWGVSWYINGLLIPEVNVVRGKTYTFVVEGGFDPDVPAKYHPFYITDDPVGGYEYKTPEEKKSVRIFAGAKLAKDGSVHPVGTGRLCHWTQKGDLEADDFDSFGAYQRTLELKCDQGEPGVIQWTPDQNTPDTVYYQCFTHRYLGWKINVHDSCDAQTASSEIKASIVPAPDLESSASINTETRVKPNDILKEDKEDKASKSTVSVPLKLDTPQNDGQPQLNEPILIQPQQNFFNPPSFYMSHGQLFAQNTYNPYIFENPFYQYPYQQNNFKPSPTINTVLENSESTTSTEKPSTTTTMITTPTTISNIPKLTKKIVAFASEIKPVNHSFTKPAQSTNKLVIRNNRPMMGTIILNNQRPMGYPMMVMRPQNLQFRQVPAKTLPKKIIHRPMIKRPINMHLPPVNNKPIFLSDLNKRRPLPAKQSFIILKPPVMMNSEFQIKNTQTITEREPEIQTALPIPQLSVFENEQTIKLHLASNTGFHPESVVIESGFKPIVSKEFQRRISEDEPDIEYENSEIGEINLSKNDATPQLFEPIFVPSPIDKQIKDKRQKKPYMKKVIIKHIRSLMEEDLDEPIAAAAERIESYYLPPPDQTNKPVELPRERSNIDLESPPDVVVTYDGKKVSGASLTARIASERSSVLEMRASKAAEFIKARPQFVPFKGELPPLNPNININAPQLKARGVISRDLDTPSLPTPNGSTRLSLVRQERGKREAHHTPEHTAQQERARNAAGKTQVYLGFANVVIIAVIFM